MNENIKCVITDLKEREDFSMPKVFIEDWIKENLEDILQGRYRFDGTYELNKQQE